MATTATVDFAAQALPARHRGVSLTVSVSGILKAVASLRRPPGTLMTIHLHAFDTPNARKITVALEEMELPYEVHIVDIGRGEQFDPAFLAISPNNKIPAIVDTDGPGGRPISVFESGAILLYLAEKTGRFLPRELASRVAVFEWLM